MTGRLAVLTVALLLGGCATIFPPEQTAALMREPPKSLPAQVEQTAVPFFPQTPYHCGPAALATTLTDAGLATTPDALGEELFLPAREGTLQTEMLAAARRNGALAVRLPRQLSAVLAEVAAGHPVIVLQNLGLSFAPVWHYAVVVGYDLGHKEIVLRSGTTQREIELLGTFERTWARGGYWAIATLPPDRLPATAEETDAVQAAVGFERAAKPAQSAIAYRTVLTRWPDNLVARMGLGNALYAAGDKPGAADAYAQAARSHDSAAAWNNLATVQWELGRRDDALKSARHAVERASTAEPEWVDATKATLKQVGGG